jgi:xylulokinase
MITLGIDSGTQSTKTIAIDTETGEIIASAQRSYSLIDGLPPGHLEQHPQDWLDAVDATIGECISKLGPRKGEISAIGVSGQQHGMVALDRQNNVVRPAKLWCDTSTTEQCAQFTKEFGGTEGLIKLAGNAILPGYTAPKILWLKQHEPENFAATTTFLLPHDYINYWLSGEKLMEFGDASGTGLLDVRTREWCAPLVQFIDEKLADALPPLRSSRQASGLLREELRAKWGLGKSVVISAGGGDNMMGAIGTGNVSAGVVTASLGTSGTLYSYSDEPVVDAEGEVAAFCDSTDAWMPLVCTMNVTVATETARALFGWGVREFDDAVKSAAPGAGGLLFLPYLNGERTPNLPRGCGVFHGLTTANMTPQNMARATMEGATLGLAYGLKRFRDLGIHPTEIRLTGGGSKSAVWRELCANVFGAHIVCLQSAEGAALGAAVQAAWTAENVAGKTGTLADTVARLVKLDESTRVEPDAELVKLYDGLLTKQTELTRKLHNAGCL